MKLKGFMNDQVWLWRTIDSKDPMVRLMALLMINKGIHPSVVAEAIGCSIPTLYTWGKRFKKDGIKGLRPSYSKSLTKAKP